MTTAQNPQTIDRSGTPLCVDLDGTLLRGDMLFETVFALIRSKPWMVIPLLGWLLSGRAYLKARLAEAAGPLVDVSSLPYDEDLLSYVRIARASGRRVELISASDEKLVRRVADHLGCFDDAVGSDGTRNLKGAVKAAFLAERYPGGFVYAGDSHADLKVWEIAAGAVLVGPGLGLESRVSVPVEARFGVVPDFKRLLPKAMRVHQWTKNGLIFLPLLLTNGLGNVVLIFETLLAFFVFCVIASATYILNDLLDLSADRSHPRKKNRPIPSGRLPVPIAVMVAVGLVGLGLLGASQLGAFFLMCLASYVSLTLAYSLGIKAVAVVDVATLGGLFTLRLLAGHALIAGSLPAWLLVFSMFFFTSLALVKRLTEVQGLEERGISGVPGRGYRAGDGRFILTFGLTAGVASILIFMIYLVAEPLHAERLSEPYWLWVVPAVLGIWLPRVWLLAARGDMHDDPVVFAVRDRTSLCLGSIALLAVLVAA
jgi:4-hydroxybenzoate polyprenyltransferase